MEVISGDSGAGGGAGEPDRSRPEIGTLRAVFSSLWRARGGLGVFSAAEPGTRGCLIDVGPDSGFEFRYEPDRSLFRRPPVRFRHVVVDN